MSTQHASPGGKHDSSIPFKPNSNLEKAVQHFIDAFEKHPSFFDDSFVKDVKRGSKRALTLLQRHAMPPTPMDLRKELEACIEANVPDQYLFKIKNGRVFTMGELKKLVPKWASIAETSLIASDPVLADKLMTPEQWNAKSAFEVAFASAMNELKEIRKTKKVSATIGHYQKWTINPLKKAMEEVRAVKTPGNALIGYGDRVPLAGALKIAETIEKEFHLLVK